MSGITRRHLLERLTACVGSAGTFVVAQAVLGDTKEAAPAVAAPDERAQRLADELGEAPESFENVSFLNRTFRNGGGFRNSVFRNGGFRNGGFLNGGFRNGGFRNGGFRNGVWRNW